MEVYDEIMSLSDKAKIAYMKAFVKLANADGKFDDNERKFIENMAKSYLLPKSCLPEIFSASDRSVVASVKNIKSRRAALELVRDLCFLAYSDNDFSDKEEVLIAKIGKAMGVSAEKLEEIRSWVLKKLILNEEAKLVFEEV